MMESGYPGDSINIRHDQKQLPQKDMIHIKTFSTFVLLLQPTNYRIIC